MKKETVICACGQNIPPHTWKKHLNGRHCTVDTSTKGWIVNILNLKSQKPVGWLISEGAEANANNRWYLSIINRLTKLSDWSFVSPRSIGLCRPSTLKRFSELRRGSANPTCKKYSTDFDKISFDKFLSDQLLNFEHNNVSIFELKRLTNSKFPNFMYSVSEEHSGATFSDFVAHKMRVSRADLLKILQKKRGKRISVGQKKSEKCIQSAREMGAKLIKSFRRLSGPQRVLFEQILVVDPQASLEKPFKINNRWVSYDIFSPKINACIEMHGDIWHKVTGKTSSRLLDLVHGNIKNDFEKQEFAESIGLKYLVFWQSDHRLWEERIFSIYGTKTISIKDAKNSVDKKTGKKTRL